MNLVHVQGCFKRWERLGLTSIGEERSSPHKAPHQYTKILTYSTSRIAWFSTLLNSTNSRMWLLWFILAQMVSFHALWQIHSMLKFPLTKVFPTVSQVMQFDFTYEHFGLSCCNIIGYYKGCWTYQHSQHLGYLVVWPSFLPTIIPNTLKTC